MAIVPKKLDLEILKGSDYIKELTIAQQDLTPIDLTGWIIRAQVRKKRDKETDVIFEFTINYVDLANGRFNLEIDDITTDAIAVTNGFYDVLFTDPAGIDEYYVYGDIKFLPTVTEKA